MARRPGCSSASSHRTRLLIFGLVLCLCDGVCPIVDPRGGPLLSLAFPAAGVAFAAFAVSEARSWRQPLTPGHGLVLVWWPYIAFPAYLLSTTYRRRPVVTVALTAVVVLKALWPAVATALGAVFEFLRR